jgi:protocatechuate 3,4-dioxygenase beta subunit
MTRGLLRLGDAMKRRELLAGLGAASVTSALPGANAFAQTAAGVCVLTPVTSDGPFYFDPKLVRADITEGKPGVPLELVLRVVTVGDCASLKEARADVWQSDAMGVYSGYDKQTGTGKERTLSATGKTFLRGTQFTDESGAAIFKTIYPSWYTGRTPHIHFKVFVGGDRVVTSQVVFPEEINNEIFGKVGPYKARDPARDTFNANDAYLRNGLLGVMCNIQRKGHGYRATVDVGVEKV